MHNVVIVGFGFMGMTHAANIIKNSHLNLVAIVDKDVEGIQQKLTSNTGNFAIEDLDQETLGGINKYSDLQRCLDTEKVDAVHVCVHTDLHYTIAKQLLSKGLHVFLEKPMTLDVKEGQELIDLAHKNHCGFMVGHVVRFMPPYQQLKRWIEEKTYGPLKFLSMTRFSGVPTWGQWKEKQTDFGSSGGALFDLLIHDIDMVNYLFGKPDNIESTLMPGYLSNNDYTCAFWTYNRSGVKVKVEGGNVFHSQFPFQAGFSAQFEEASVFYSTLVPESIQVATHDVLSHVKEFDGSDGFYNEIDYFYQCIRGGEQPKECLPESSLDTIRLCYQHLKKIQ